jgi:hypothetical protein
LGGKRKVAAKALTRFKQRIRQLTRRSGGRGMAEVVESLRAYRRVGKPITDCRKRRASGGRWMNGCDIGCGQIQLKHWKRGRTMYWELRNRGAQRVAGNSRCWWRNSSGEIKRILTIAYFNRLGVPRLL